MKQIGRSQGSGGKRGIPALVHLYRFVFDRVRVGAEDDDIINALKEHDTLRFLYVQTTEEEMGDEDGNARRRFSKSAKAAVILRETLSGELGCAECKARLYRKSVSSIIE